MSISIKIASNEQKVLSLDDIKNGEFILAGSDATLYQRVTGGHSQELLRTNASAANYCWLNVKTGRVFAQISSVNIRRVDLEVVVKVQ